MPKLHRRKFNGKTLPLKAQHDILAIEKLEKILPREELVTVLEVQGDEKFEHLLNLMFDPLYRKHKLPALCRRAGLQFGDLIDAFRKAKCDEGIINMARHVPEVLEDVAIDAKSKQVPCEVCKATGISQTSMEGLPENCKRCDGKGEYRVPGDASARKLVFDAMGLTGKSGPLIDMRSINVTGAEDVEESLKAAKALLSPVIEGQK